MDLRMSPYLKLHYKKEIQEYRDKIRINDFQSAWNALERSHILGQKFPGEHTYSHWLMLKFGFKIRDFKEVLGQIPRLFVGGIKSFVGVIPVGNSGGANVSPLKPMEIPEDLKKILEHNKK